MRLQGCLSVERMCQLAEVSRAGFYGYLQGGSEAEEALALRSAIQDVVMEHRWRYGYRRVAEELRTQGWIVNHKRIARIMREDNLLTVQRDWFRPLRFLRAARIYLNLANRMTVLGPNQLLGGRHNLYPSHSRVCLSRGCPGRLFSQGHRLGARPKP
jgi:hypothetical protein